MGIGRVHQDARHRTGTVQHPCERDRAGAVEGDRIEKVLQVRADEVGISFDEAKKDALAVQSLKRFVDPKEIAALAMFLASDAGKSISGQVLPIDNDSHQAS